MTPSPPLSAAELARIVDHWLSLPTTSKEQAEVALEFQKVVLSHEALAERLAETERERDDLHDHADRRAIQRQEDEVTLADLRAQELATLRADHAATVANHKLTIEERTYALEQEQREHQASRFGLLRQIDRMEDGFNGEIEARKKAQADLATPSHGAAAVLAAANRWEEASGESQSSYDDAKLALGEAVRAWRAARDEQGGV